MIIILCIACFSFTVECCTPPPLLPPRLSPPPVGLLAPGPFFHLFVFFPQVTVFKRLQLRRRRGVNVASVCPAGGLPPGPGTRRESIQLVPAAAARPAGREGSREGAIRTFQCCGRSYACACLSSYFVIRNVVRAHECTICSLLSIYIAGQARSRCQQSTRSGPETCHRLQQQVTEVYDEIRGQGPI